MRRARIGASALIAFVAPSLWAQAVDQSFESLRAASPTLQIVLHGTDTRNRGTRYRTVVTYQDNGGLAQNVEVDEYSGTLATPDSSLPLARRIAGDGTTMWAYGVSANAYTALRYGQYKGAQLTTYRDDFFHALLAAADGQSAPALRLLAELYENGGGATYKPWMTGNAPMLQLEYSTPLAPEPPVWTTSPSGPGYPDPIDPNLQYVPSVSGTTAVDYQFIYEPSLRHSIAFEVTGDTNTGVWTLSRMFSTQGFASGDLAEWDISFTAPVIDPNQFLFVPPSGSHALVGRVGG